MLRRADRIVGEDGGMGDAAGDAWRRITAWIADNAPDTAAQVRGPGDAGLIDAVERDVGVPLPPDLRAWWCLADGFHPGVLQALIPWIHVPLPIAVARDERRHLVELSARAGWPDSDGYDAEAGSFSHRYQATFVPISTDHCGQVLFVDLRPGTLHGTVSEWDHEEGFLRPPHWMGVTDMLSDIGDALELGQPAMVEYAERLRAAGFGSDPRAWAEVTHTGELEWNGR
jgi:cell wall assembly regulator SMI1